MGHHLVIIDETPESRLALRYAMGQAQAIDGSVLVLVSNSASEFQPFSGVQAALQAEAREEANVLIAEAAGDLVNAVAVEVLPTMVEPIAQLHTLLSERTDIVALVLGASANGGPGPLVDYFSARAGQLPCPLVIVPPRILPPAPYQSLS